MSLVTRAVTRWGCPHNATTPFVSRLQPSPSSFQIAMIFDGILGRWFPVRRNVSRPSRSLSLSFSLSRSFLHSISSFNFATVSAGATCSGWTMRWDGRKYQTNLPPPIFPVPGRHERTRCNRTPGTHGEGSISTFFIRREEQAAPANEIIGRLAEWWREHG